MVSTLFRDPQARSSALAALGTLQPRAFGSLNHVETLDSVSNYYIVSSMAPRNTQVVIGTVQLKPPEVNTFCYGKPTYTLALHKKIL